MRPSNSSSIAGMCMRFPPLRACLWCEGNSRQIDMHTPKERPVCRTSAVCHHGSCFHVAIIIAFTHLLARLIRGVRAQELSEAVNSSISFLDSGLTTLGHITAFLNAVMRGRMDCETVCREALSSALHGVRPVDRAREILEDTSPRAKSLLALASKNRHHETLQFLLHCQDVYGVEAVLLLCAPLTHYYPEQDTLRCPGEDDCSCLVLDGSLTTLTRLVKLFPGAVLKTHIDDIFVLPCTGCFVEKCCHVEQWPGLHLQNRILEPGERTSDLLPIMSMFFDEDSMPSFLQGKAFVCVPLLSRGTDEWTRSVMRMVQTKDDKDRGAVCEIRTTLEEYLAGNEALNSVTAKEFGIIDSTLPRLLEAVLTMVLSLWFRVDGFSASLVSRRAVRGYVTDAMGNASYIGYRVKKVIVLKSGSCACQAFFFRDGCCMDMPKLPTSSTAVLMIGVLSASLSTVMWCMSAATNKWPGHWSSTYSAAPTSIRSWFCCAAVMGCLLLDCVHISQTTTFSFTDLVDSIRVQSKNQFIRVLRNCMKGYEGLLLVMIIEGLLAVSIMAVLLLWHGNKAYFRFLYIAMELLSWIKWAYGSYQLGSNVSDLYSSTHDVGRWVYASAFLAAGTLAAVGGNWN